jgi:uncharacterized protein YceH (UPF0502 family)
MNEGSTPASEAAKWTPIGRVERRVLGVLVEKAKTTPEAYPMTLNGLTTGCNQKNNRDPAMTLEPHQVESALEKLRHASAVIEVAGSGRVAKYRHRMYEWLGVDTNEAAVMTELLLRGTQTVGELRGRASRMQPIKDLPALHALLEKLIERRLVVALTPAGRGQVVTHGLYLPEEWDKVRAAARSLETIESESTNDAGPPDETPVARRPAITAGPSGVSAEELATLRSEVEALREEVTNLARELRELQAALS